MLEFFMTHPERVYTRDQLLDRIWGGNVYVEERTIDVHIRRLRKALEEFGYDRFIQTVRGSGYGSRPARSEPPSGVASNVEWLSKSASSSYCDCSPPPRRVCSWVGPWAVPGQASVSPAVRTCAGS